MLGLGNELNGLPEIRRYKTEFEELDKIGHGGFSTVFRARHRLDNRFYAVKKIKIKPAEHKPNLQEYFDKVFRQGKVLCEINHPNVLKYHCIWFEVGHKVKPKGNQRDLEPKNETNEFEMIIDSQDSQDSSSICFADPVPKIAKEHHTPERKPKPLPKIQRNKSDKKEPSSSQHPIDYSWLLEYSDVTIYIQTELCKETLNEFVDKRRAVRSGADPASSIENYKFVLDLVDGIECMHNRKIIHRDIKMHNILLDFKGQCKICDFGLAKRSKGSKSCFILSDIIPNAELTEEDLEKFSSSVGTKIFSSPQQSSSTVYDHRTDIYSLGIIIGILFSTWKTKHEEFDLINKIRGRSITYLNIDPRIVDIIQRSMMDPQYRPTLKEIRKCFIDLLNPPMLFNIRFPDEDCFKERMAILKGGVLYIGENNRYTCMLKVKDMTLHKEKQHYTIQRSGKPAFEVENEDGLLGALTTS